MSDILALRQTLDFDALGQEMHSLVRDLYPLCRSITGEGLRETLRRTARAIGGPPGRFEIHEVASGTPVFDWTVPNEWTIRQAYINGPGGQRIVDFRNHNLHVWGYSQPVRATMTLAELKPHLASSAAHPDWIPYRTTYYQPNWGFALPHRQLEALPEGDYEVVIDATLAPGSLSYGELLIPGATRETIFVSTHCCHPSLCNDNLCGIATATMLARLLQGTAMRHSLRFVFAPGTIGAITWLARNPEAVRDIRHGFVVAGGGDGGAFHYKQSRRGDAEVDQIVEHVLRTSGAPFEVTPFIPYGYDERQYCSPGFDLPVGALTRTPHGRFPEYHMSADNPDFVRPEHMAATLQMYLAVFSALETNATYRNLNPMCEPQLGRRGLYRQTGGHVDQPQREAAMLWLLNLSDGQHSLLDVARRAGLPFDAVVLAARDLQAHQLLEPVSR